VGKGSVSGQEGGSQFSEVRSEPIPRRRIEGASMGDIQGKSEMPSEVSGEEGEVGEER